MKGAKRKKMIGLDFCAIHRGEDDIRLLGTIGVATKSLIMPLAATKSLGMTGFVNVRVKASILEFQEFQNISCIKCWEFLQANM